MELDIHAVSSVFQIYVVGENYYMQTIIKENYQQYTTMTHRHTSTNST